MGLYIITDGSGRGISPGFGEIEITDIVSKVTGDMFDERIQLMKEAGDVRSYSELLKELFEQHEEAAEVYVGSGERGIKYYVSGPGARQYVAKIRGR